MSDQLRKDLSRNLQEQVGETLQRHTRLASAVLNQADVAIMLVELSASVCLTTAATVAASAKPDADRGELFDETLAGIARFAAADRERSMAAVAAQTGAAA